MKVKINKAQYVIEKKVKVETMGRLQGPIEIFFRKDVNHLGWKKLGNPLEGREIILIERNQ